MGGGYHNQKFARMGRRAAATAACGELSTKHPITMVFLDPAWWMAVHRCFGRSRDSTICVWGEHYQMGQDRAQKKMGEESRPRATGETASNALSNPGRTTANVC
mmetsp:Transcript_55900/g.77065  ORF Transcript_55900/g.77065 Transcript_55900/m.77065 type:complete len:104 (-) Transcript_55900:162-473(-)